MSAVSYSGRAWSKMWGLPLKSFRHLFPFNSYVHFQFPLPVPWPTYELPMSTDVPRCRPMSSNVRSVIFGSGMVENVGVAIGIASPSVSVQKLFALPVSRPKFELSMSAGVGQCRQCHIRVGHGRKCWGSRWNRLAICFRSKAISTSGL